MEKIKTEDSPMHCLFQSNVGDVKVVSLMPYRTNILGHKIFYRKLKIKSVSIRMGNVEYTMTQKDNRRWNQRSTPLNIYWSSS